MSRARSRASARRLHLRVKRTDLIQLSGLDSVQCRKNGRHEWQKILNPIRPRHDQHDPEWQNRQVLFALKLAVHRDERIDLAARAAKEFTVFHASPAHALNAGDVVP